MRGTKSKEKFSQELEMSRSNYSRIESGKSDPTIKTLEQIAKLTNSTLVVDLIPNEPTEPEPETEQVTLELEMEEEKSNDFVWIMHEIIAYFFKKRYTRYNETTNWIKNTKKLDNRNQVKIKKISMIFHGFYCTPKIPEEKALFFRVV